MKKTWNVTLYHDGEPISERHGVSQDDAVAQIYALSRTTKPVEALDQAAAPQTAELRLAA